MKLPLNSIIVRSVGHICKAFRLLEPLDAIAINGSFVGMLLPAFGHSAYGIDRVVTLNDIDAQGTVPDPCAVPRFTPGVVYDSGGLGAPVLADLNRDGRLDLIAVDFSSRNPSQNGSTNSGILVLLSTADGTWKNPITYHTGVQPRFLAVGDLNGDGKVDVIVANQGSSLIGRDYHDSSYRYFLETETGAFARRQ